MSTIYVFIDASNLWAALKAKGKFPSKTKATESEIYQMLVAATRAKKRIYMVNTIGKEVSDFADCLTSGDWERLIYE